jgi:hypothetical protein
MRSFSIICICLVVGCSQTPSEPVHEDSPAPAAAPAPQPEPARAPNGLYTDEEIRKLAKFDIDKESGGDRGILGMACLDVVPAGKSYPRSKVFKALNIDDARIRDFRHIGFYRVVFLTWQVSPSYDICCMTAINDPENLIDPNRKVYGIRLVKRTVPVPEGPEAAPQ